MRKVKRKKLTRNKECGAKVNNAAPASDALLSKAHASEGIAKIRPFENISDEAWLGTTAQSQAIKKPTKHPPALVCFPDGIFATLGAMQPCEHIYHFSNALAHVNPLPNAARQTRSPVLSSHLPMLRKALWAQMLLLCFHISGYYYKTGYPAVRVSQRCTN